MSVDEKIFNTSIFKLDLGKYVVFSNRSLDPGYNVDLLIKAIPFVLEIISDVKFIVAETGAEKDKIEELAKILGIQKHTEFIGKIPREDMPQYLVSSTIFVSTSPREGASVSLLEAMACGIFPIVTDIPANREWIKDGDNGFLFPVNDEKILAGQIIKVIQNKTIREKAKKINIEIIKQRALWKNNIKKIEEYYERLL